MPGKMARSAPDHRSGCPMRWWPSIPRVWLAGRPDKREYSRLFGSHLGNPSLIGRDSTARPVIDPSYGAGTVGTVGVVVVVMMEAPPEIKSFNV